MVAQPSRALSVRISAKKITINILRLSLVSSVLIDEVYDMGMNE